MTVTVADAEADGEVDDLEGDADDRLSELVGADAGVEVEEAAAVLEELGDAPTDLAAELVDESTEDEDGDATGLPAKSTFELLWAVVMLLLK